MPLLLIYIPTFGRARACAERVRQLAWQRRRIANPPDVRIVVSINGDSAYSREEIEAMGADEVLLRKINLGGNANIALGLEYCEEARYLWILGDDDPLADGALARVMGLLSREPDLLCVSRSSSDTLELTATSLANLETHGAFVGSISANILRGATFREYARVAFDGIFTSYPHTFLIQQVLTEVDLRVVIHPARGFIDYSTSVAELADVSRAVAARTQSLAFFGGGILVASGQSGKFDGRAFRRWWLAHWHRVSMYRKGRPIQAKLVDRLAQARPITAALWLASLPQWWRLKDRLRPRGKAGIRDS